MFKTYFEEVSHTKPLQSESTIKAPLLSTSPERKLKTHKSTSQKKPYFGKKRQT